MTHDSQATRRALALDYRLLLKFVILEVAAGFLLRIALLFNPQTLTEGIGPALWVLGFLEGALSDGCVALLLLVPLWAFAMSVSSWKFGRPQGFVALGLLAALWVYLVMPGTALAEFNRSLARVLSWVVVYWAASFALRMFVPRVRDGWTRCWMAVIVTIYVVILVFNVVGEWLFWDEFGVRYNFIAVDYLIYTSEVVGNIWESYPMWWIIAGIVAVSAAITALLFRREIACSTELRARGWRYRQWPVFLGLPLAAVLLPLLARWGEAEPVVWREFKASGPYSFYEAFFKNELDYGRFYYTISKGEVEAELAAADSPAAAGADTVAVRDFNIVVITLESMSADFMSRFGNVNNLTPTLDSLYRVGIAFDNLFAAGNRTVRGLEALTLCRPPSPGESIIKRPDNSGYPCVADMAREIGYTPVFFYGGDAYFDNMESYYGAQGYRIVDKKSYAADEIEFATVWGVCDEDAYAKMLKELDSTPQPFLAQMMSTSNHRPYTYPDGRIAIPPTSKSRNGGVMYSDYALGRFFEQARGKKWFSNTVFVVVADHCASSAGSTELPLTGYHIPAVIYAPALIEPQVVGKVVSQIDIMPTVFALLGHDTGTRFYGRNALSPGYESRAFVATYQDLGYLERDTLTVVSPGRKVRQYAIILAEGDPYAMKPVDEVSESHLRRAVAMYQSSAAACQ